MSDPSKLTKAEQEALDWIRESEKIAIDESIGKDFADKVRKRWLEEFERACESLNVGELTKNRSIVAGTCPDTGRKLFAMHADAYDAMTFEQALEHVASVNKNRTLHHDDWRIPTEEELDVLYDNRDKGALQGSFAVTFPLDYARSWYWSSTCRDPSDDPYCRRFADGRREHRPRRSPASLRLVCG